MNIDLTYEQADAITVATLLESLEISRASSAQLQEKIQQGQKLEIYQLQDLSDDLFTALVLEATLSYFLPRDEFEAMVGKKHPIRGLDFVVPPVAAEPTPPKQQADDLTLVEFGALLVDLFGKTADK